MEDAGDDHTDEQYELHGAPPTHKPEAVQQGLSAHKTMRGPKRQSLYENRADRNDH